MAASADNVLTLLIIVKFPTIQGREFRLGNVVVQGRAIQSRTCTYTADPSKMRHKLLSRVLYSEYQHYPSRARLGQLQIKSYFGWTL